MKAENHINEISINYNKKLYSPLTIKTSLNAEQVARNIYSSTPFM
jgi:hypothetical protein